jgi:dihydroorotate dehydrogenase electron transfer subunit
LKLKILENRKLSDRDYLLKVKVPENSSNRVKPGQFAMVQVRKDNQFDPLLRRPFGIFDVEGDSISFLYRVFGRGTSLLTEAKGFIDVIFPLGNFINDNASKFLFIAGGIGIGGIFLAAKLFHQRGKTVKVIYGERTGKNLSALEFLDRYGINYTVITEDGSVGKKGLVTDFLQDYTDFTWVACGPVQMLKEVKRKSEEVKAECFLSLDSRMACGIGACLGCVVKTPSGFKRVCVEGPIFNSKDVIL